MFGISGTALGAILRATKKDYKEISAVAGVYAIVVLLISVFVFLITSWGVGDLATWMPESIVDATSPFLILIGSLLIGIGAFVSMLIGALVFDASEAIIKGMR
jgi:hypothetical protein